jgi:hypothetical protein
MAAFLPLLLAFLGACSPKGEGPPLTADSGAPTGDTGASDSAPPRSTWYPDVDLDGYGDPAAPVEAEVAPAGFVADDQDCDDADTLIHPGAAERCNARDDDCDSEIDEGLPTTLLYPDVDGDGWGDESAPEARCDSPTGYLATGEDCDDSRAAVYPGAPDICGNGLDDGCTGEPDSRCRPEGELSLADSGVKYLGSTEGGLTGAAVTCGGDTDGDGQPELLIGETEEYDFDAEGAPGPGGAWLVGGLSTGEVLLEDVAAASIWGEPEAPLTWHGMGFVGDLDLDGYDEVLVETALFNGPVVGPLLVSDADTTLIDDFGSVQLGGSVAALGNRRFAIGGSGNLFQDGYWGADVGAVYIFEGPLESSERTHSAVASFQPDVGHEYGNFGWALCSGDLNGDGEADLAIGAPSLGAESRRDFMTWGLVYLMDGPFSGDLRMSDWEGTLIDADARIEGADERSGTTGYSLSCGGDTDGDGHDDLLVGALGEASSGEYMGAAALFRGPIATGVQTVSEADGVVYGDTAFDEVGSSVSVDADIDADGLDDVVVGSFLDGYPGEIYIFYDGFSGTVDRGSADATLQGEAPGAAAGRVAGCPDLDGDGADDLLIGAAGDRTYGEWAGAAYVVFGGPE